MLCEKCKNKGIDCQMTAKAQGFVMGFSGKKPMHKVGALWFPGRTPKDLEDWCAKNCKPAKPAKPAKPVEEKIIEPATEEVKMVGSNKKWLNKNEKKD